MPSQPARQPERRGLRRRLLLVPAFAAALAGCQTSGTGRAGAVAGAGPATPAGTLVASNLDQQQALSAVQTWSAAYGRNEKDRTAAMNYAAALRAAGETKQAVAVMRKALIYHPKDEAVLAAYGKALAEDGQFEEALATIQRAQRRDNPDWQLLAAEGGILDSLGDYDNARQAYRQALVLAPGEPQILNNLAMSYVLTGDLDEAEETLRQAVASPKATVRTRQNLELVLALKSKGKGKGKGSEAASLSGQSAPQHEPQGDAAPPAGDLATEQDTWKEIEKSG